MKKHFRINILSVLLAMTLLFSVAALHVYAAPDGGEDQAAAADDGGAAVADDPADDPVIDAPPEDDAAADTPSADEPAADTGDSFDASLEGLDTDTADTPDDSADTGDDSADTAADTGADDSADSSAQDSGDTGSADTGDAADQLYEYITGYVDDAYSDYQQPDNLDDLPQTDSGEVIYATTMVLPDVAVTNASLTSGIIMWMCVAVGIALVVGVMVSKRTRSKKQ